MSLFGNYNYNIYYTTNQDIKIIGDRDEILYFLKDFYVSSTNNQAERVQRNAKMKQKTGKWKSIDETQIYVIIRSYINTYK